MEIELIERQKVTGDDFDKGKVGVNLEECYLHRNTTVLGKPLIDSKKCDCCGFKYQKEDMGLDFSAKDVYYLGSGFALYFVFIKVAIIIVFFTSMAFSGANIYFNYISDSCIQSQKVICSSSLYLKISVANKLNNDWGLHMQGYLADGTIILVFFLLQIGRKWMREVDMEAQAESDASDYAIMICMPTTNYYEQDVKNCIGEWWKKQYQKIILKKKMPFESCGENFPIYKVIISYELSVFDELNQKLKKLKEKEKDQSEKKSKEQSQQIKTQIQSIEQKIRNKDLTKNKKCVVLLTYPDQKDYILEKHQKTIFNTLFSFCYNLVRFNKEKVRITKPALPTEINWNNHEIKAKTKLFTRFFVKIFCFLIIVVAEAGVYGLLRYWFSNKNETTSTLSAYISPLISVAINLINMILYKLLIYISKFEYRPTTLEEKVSITLKITISVFLNSGIMLLAAYFFLDMTSIWTQGGFIETMTYSFLMSTIIPHIVRYLDFGMIMAFFKRSIIKCSKNQGMTQRQANEIFQRTNVELYEKYAWMINMVWWGSIFSPLIPIAYPCVFISLFLHFWNEKFQYVTMLKEPKPFGSYLNKQMINLLEMTPVFLAGGNLGLNLILTQINKQSIQIGLLFFDLIAVGVSFLIFFFPSQQLSRLISCIFCLNNQYTVANKPYQTVKDIFLTTYELENPIYRDDELRKIQQPTDESHNMSSYSNKSNPFNPSMQHPIKLYNSRKPQNETNFLIPISSAIQNQGRQYATSRKDIEMPRMIRK